MRMCSHYFGGATNSRTVSRGHFLRAAQEVEDTRSERNQEKARRQQIQNRFLKEQRKVESAPALAGVRAERIIDARTPRKGRLCHGCQSRA